MEQMDREKFRRALAANFEFGLRIEHERGVREGLIASAGDAGRLSSALAAQGDDIGSGLAVALVQRLHERAAELGAKIVGTVERELEGKTVGGLPQPTREKYEREALKFRAIGAAEGAVQAAVLAEESNHADLRALAAGWRAEAAKVL